MLAVDLIALVRQEPTQLHQAGHEQLPELRAILEESFLQDEAGRWYVPDPGRAQDLERLHERALLRE